MASSDDSDSTISNSSKLNALLKDRLLKEVKKRTPKVYIKDRIENIAIFKTLLSPAKQLTFLEKKSRFLQNFILNQQPSSKRQTFSFDRKKKSWKPVYYSSHSLNQKSTLKPAYKKRYEEKHNVKVEKPKSKAVFFRSPAPSDANNNKLSPRNGKLQFTPIPRRTPLEKISKKVENAAINVFSDASNNSNSTAFPTIFTLQNKKFKIPKRVGYPFLIKNVFSF